MPECISFCHLEKQKPKTCKFKLSYLDCTQEAKLIRYLWKVPHLSTLDTNCKDSLLTNHNKHNSIGYSGKDWYSQVV